MSLVNIHRRAFLRKSAIMSAALGTAGPWALNLAAMSEAAAQTATDYKALVCVFLSGGNDYGNTLIPYDSVNYNAYKTIRGTLAYAQDALAATVLQPRTALPDARKMALAPELAPLKNLFDSGSMGVLLNIGTLVQPTTLTQYTNKSVPLPPKLFSHNDQQSVWQSCNPEGASSGWGGRIGDLSLSSNGNAMFTAMSVSGNTVFLSGVTASQYAITSSGSVALNGAGSSLFGSSTCASTLRTLITQQRTNVLENAHVKVMQRSLDGDAKLKSALGGIAAMNTQFDSKNSLAMQLQMVAKLIAARNSLSVKRQVFFVSLGGFDHHDSLTSLHPGLLKQVADALSSFYSATVELGVADQVTSFTASEFGRTLSSNGDGSDHGWGSHHFVVGGAVAGQNFHGILPATAVSGPDDVGQGRLLPTTSVDQLGASLASWFGVGTSDMKTVLPNSGNFNLSTLKLFGG